MRGAPAGDRACVQRDFRSGGANCAPGPYARAGSGMRVKVIVSLGAVVPVS